MKSTDKFLIGIVISILILAGVAFAIALSRPEPTYQSEDSPAGIVHNYLLAIQKEEYDRAYAYLSPELSGYPESVEEFEAQIEGQSWVFRSDDEVDLAVEEERINGDRADVEVRESRFYQGDLFNTRQYTDNFDLTLRLQSGQWKITNGDQYFAYCWQDDEGCQ